MAQERYRELSLTAQTAFAELFERAQAATLQRSIANLSGGFASKLQPLKYMEFLLEQPDTSVVLSEEGAAVVNLPNVIRYALHKVVVATERSTRWRTR